MAGLDSIGNRVDTHHDPDLSRNADISVQEPASRMSAVASAVELLTTTAKELRAEFKDYGDEQRIVFELRDSCADISEAVEAYENAPTDSARLAALNECRQMMARIAPYLKETSLANDLDRARRSSRLRILTTLAVTTLLITALLMAVSAVVSAALPCACGLSPRLVAGLPGGMVVGTITATAIHEKAIGRHVVALLARDDARRIERRTANAASDVQAAINVAYRDVFRIAKDQDSGLPAQMLTVASAAASGREPTDAIVDAYWLTVDSVSTGIQMALDYATAPESSVSRADRIDFFMDLLKNKQQVMENGRSIVRLIHITAISRWHAAVGDDKRFFADLVKRIGLMWRHLEAGRPSAEDRQDDRGALRTQLQHLYTELERIRVQDTPGHPDPWSALAHDRQRIKAALEQFASEELEAGDDFLESRQ